MADNILPTDSAGTVVVENSSTAQNTSPVITVVNEDAPQQTYQPGALTFDASGRVTNPNAETGTNPPVITTIQSQSVNADAFAPQYGTTDAEGRAVPSGTPGTQTNDDSTTRQNTKQVISSTIGSAKIVPQPNILDQYASYTYSISWYLMAPEAYKTLLTSQKKTLTGFQLLMQSGGAPVSGDPYGAVRNQFFSNDYYIDNLELESRLLGRGTGLCHNVSDIKFTVTEPQGITLIGNLYRAVDQYYKSLNVKTSTPGNYENAEYCLVIRFYGYNDQGQLIQVGKDVNTGTDKRAVVEKFYPFNIVNIGFTVANKVVEYRVEAKPIGHNISLGTSRGTIPYQIELTGTTVKDILVGKPNSSAVTPSADGRQTTPQAPQALVGQGVLDAQAASGTNSTDFTNTQQTNLIGTPVIPGVASSF